MATRDADILSFEEADTLVGPRIPSPLSVAQDVGPSPCGQKTSSKCETCFTLQSSVAAADRQLSRLRRIQSIHFVCTARYCARLVICVSFVLGIPQMLASDNDGSRASLGAEEASLPQPVSSRQVKLPKSDKYDVDRIGQRDIGHGLNEYSLERERAMGERMASAIDRGTRFVADPEVNDYINRLAQNVVRHSDAEVPFRIKVIDSSGCRVFSLPGGFLYIDKGLIAEVDTEAQLAALLAHEIAHVAARHATRLATRKHAWNLLSIPLVWASGPAALGTKQIGPLSLNKFNRDAEIEADLLGIEYQYAAGYDPNAFVEALEKLYGKENQGRANSSPGRATTLHTQIARVFSSYPPIDERIQKLQTEISSFLPTRNDYVLDTSEFQAVKAKVTDRLILRRNRSGDGPAEGPVLRRAQSDDLEPTHFAESRTVTKGPLSPVFSYLPVSGH